MPRIPFPADSRLRASVLVAAAWLVCAADWMWSQKLPAFINGPVFALAGLFAAFGMLQAGRMRRTEPGRAALIATLAFIPLWQSLVYALDLAGWAAARVRLAETGTAAAWLIGLLWVIRAIDQTTKLRERQRLALLAAGRSNAEAAVRTSNPLDAAAWFYGRRAKKLNQSVSAFTAWTLLFYLAFLVMTRAGGCQEIYEMPAGGGQQQQIAQTVKVQKVIRKKFVVNAFSAISLKVPPIDEVKLQLNEITQHQYTVGYGAGAGAGFAGGTKQGLVRFIRLEYQGGDWDQDFGIGADENMLVEYGVRTQQKVAKKTEARTVAQLRNFPAGSSPPFVYLTGQRNIQLSPNEIKILREYLLDKHGMLFIDNGGSAHFHNQVLAVMRQVLPNVKPVPVPLDDAIHRIPYTLASIPYVAPHGGRDALGWRVDGRLVCYYSPGDIADAWADDHSGVPAQVWEACYQLGTNVIFYAHVEYAKWLEARQKR